jgi:hypothetical protein
MPHNLQQKPRYILRDLPVFIVSFSISLLSCFPFAHAQQLPPGIKTSKAVIDDFMNKRFGMFIHFGPAAVDEGFTAMKLKVVSKDADWDLRRSHLVREVSGDAADIMLDANQQRTLPQALNLCPQLQSMNPFWIEEPTHPDDILAHKVLAALLGKSKTGRGDVVLHAGTLSLIQDNWKYISPGNGPGYNKLTDIGTAIFPVLNCTTSVMILVRKIM